ncbi:MAG: Hpt domain-containing protein [Bdellovibrionota bacterium]
MRLISENQIKTIFEIDRSGELFRRLLNIFETDILNLILDLDSALKREDFLNAKKISHSIRSSSLNMGAAELAIMAGNFEDSTPMNKNYDSALIIEFQKCFQYTITELRGYLDLCKT